MGNAISVFVTPMAIMWNCARYRSFSEEIPEVYVLAVARQPLVPSLSVEEREGAANACFSIGFVSCGTVFSRGSVPPVSHRNR